MNPGQTLKEKRTQMGLSINDVAVATKINPRILKALEEGQKENLPPRSFVRGFIRSYSNYLKLNSEEILQAFESEEGISPSVASDSNIPSESKDVANKSSRDDINRMDQSSRLSTIMVTVGIVVLIVLIFGVKSMMDKYAQERVVEPAQIDGEPTPGEETATEAAAEKSEDDDDASPAPATATATADVAKDAKADEKKPAEAAKIEPTKPAVTPPTPAPAPVVAAPPAAAPAVKPAPAVTPPPAVVAPVVKPPPAVVAPVVTPPPAAEKKEVAAKPEAKGAPQEIIVEALDEVQLTVAVDGGGSKKITLKPESIHTIKAQKEVVIEVSDGGLVNIIQNGNDRGNPGQLGKAAKLKYP